MKPFFTAEDFEAAAKEGNFALGPLRAVVKLANAKLEREGKVVWSSELEGDTSNWVTKNRGEDYETHEGLLINIEPLEGDK